MVPSPWISTASVPPPAYQRAVARRHARRPLGIDALTLVTSLHLLALCRTAVWLAEARPPAALPGGRSGRPRTYSDAMVKPA